MMQVQGCCVCPTHQINAASHYHLHEDNDNSVLDASSFSSSYSCSTPSSLPHAQAERPCPPSPPNFMFPFGRHRRPDRDLDALKRQQVEGLKQAVPSARAVNSVRAWMGGVRHVLFFAGRCSPARG